MNKITILSLALILILAACNRTPAVEPVVAIEAPVTPSLAPGEISAPSTVNIIWTNGHAEMTLNDVPVKVSPDGFVYTSDKANGVQMAREKISVTVDSVSIKFLASGVGDSLDLVVEYSSAGKSDSFKLEDGNRLTLTGTN